MNTVVCYRMKPSHSNFELIPEEDQEQYYSEHNMDQVFKKEATAAAAAAAAAQQAALAARIFQAQQQQQQQQQSTTTTNSAELSLHQQLFSQQLLHQKILEEQFAVAASAAASRAGGRDFLLMSEADREKQLGIIFQQVEAQRKAKEGCQTASSGAGGQAEAGQPQLSHHEKLKLEILKQKSRQEQSAVASPEVKRHLQEFVLKKRKEQAVIGPGAGAGAQASAVGSMSNLKMVPTASNPPPPNHALLRKTASESNLLKMKHGKRSNPHGTSSPYQRASMYHQPAIPEDEVQGGSLQDSPVGSAESSGSSGLAMRPMDLGMATVRQQLASSAGSAPTSPKTGASCLASNSVVLQPQTHPLNLAGGAFQRPSHTNVELLRAAYSSGGVNSKSLPNIPSAMGVNRPGQNKVVGRRSPPASVSASGTAKQMLVRRSKSSAILPLRKHLIEKTLAEQQQKAVAAAQAIHNAHQAAASASNSSISEESSPSGKTSLSIRPIEEIMEEDILLSNQAHHQTSQRILQQHDNNSMEVDDSPQVVRHFAARLGPAGLSPLVIGEVSQHHSAKLTQEYLNKFAPANNSVSLGSGRTGLGFDPAMLRHECTCGDAVLHPENPRRLQSIWSHLVATGLADQCVKVSREATLEEIRSVHSEAHTIQYGVVSPLHQSSSKFQLLPCGGRGVDSDTYWNENYTSTAAKAAAGSVLELSTMVARGDLKNGFALVRPPGHHAEFEEAMGFCYFNNIAIAAKQLIANKLANRILIVDWAIHHGNGTQHAFYDNPNVLYISLHRHDHGNFYPGTGSPIECGNGAGLGYNINIAWAGGLTQPMGDAEYLAAFRAIVLPIGHSFDPDIILVSAGFDAAIGHPHPIGGYSVSTACFAYLTLQLRQLAHGRVVLALEGGFNEDVLNTASEQCLSALLGNKAVDKIAPEELARRPNPSAIETLQKTLAIQSPYWEVLRRFPEAALLSHFEAWEKEREQTEALRAMASLSMKQHSMSSHGSSCSIVDDVDDSSMA